MPPGSGGSQWQLLLSFVVGCPPERATVNVHLVAIDEPLDVCGHRDTRRIGGLVCFRPRRLVDSGLQQHSLETFDVGALGTTSDRGHDQSMAVNGCILRDLTCERFVSGPGAFVGNRSCRVGFGGAMAVRGLIGRPGPTTALWWIDGRGQVWPVGCPRRRPSNRPARPGLVGRRSAPWR